MIYRKRGLNPKQMANFDNLMAKVMRLSDIMEYVAMMSDVEIPTEENEDEQEDEQEV